MPSGLESSLQALILLIMLIGLFGLVVPIFPGITVIWLAALGYGVVAGFGTVGTIAFILISLLALAGVMVDNVFMAAKAHQGGAAWLSIALGFLAGVIATFIFPPLGGVIATPLVILLAEYIRQGEMNKALRALRGVAAGWGLAFVFRFIIGLIMIGAWGVWAWRG